MHKHNTDLNRPSQQLNNINVIIVFHKSTSPDIIQYLKIYACLLVTYGLDSCKDVKQVGYYKENCILSVNTQLISSRSSFPPMVGLHRDFGFFGIFYC